MSCAVPEPGQYFPALDLVDCDGVPVRPNFRPVIVVFYRGHW